MALNFGKNVVRMILPTARSVISRSYAEASPAAARSTHEMQFTFACPAAVYYNSVTNIRQVDVNSMAGSFGILPNHVPVLMAIKPGVITVYEQEGGTKKFFASSGSISVNDDNTVQILAEEAVPVEQLDLQAAKEGLASAHREVERAASEEDRAEALIEVETYEAIVRAAEAGS